MTSRGLDRILMGFGAILVLISAFQLLFPKDLENGGIKLGTLTSALSIVKTKYTSSLDWRDALIGQDLIENQLIYTDYDSRAEIIFNEGHTIEMSENSLIRLPRNQLNENLNLKHGLVRAKIEDGKSLKVNLNGEDYLLTGKDANIQINMQNERGEIGVLSGELTVNTQGISQDLDVHSALDIKGKEIKKKEIFFTALHPIKEETIYTLSIPVKIDFKWSPSVEGKILISTHPQLENAKIYDSSLDLNDGSYYYRIEGPQGISLVNNFRIIKETPPVLIRPLSGENLTVLENKVLLQWEDVGDVDYILESTSGFTTANIVQGSSALVKIGEDKDFKWRIKIYDEKRPDAIWSEWQILKVNLISLPSIPHSLEPENVEYQVYQKPHENIVLTWKGHPEVEIEVRSPAEDSILKRIKGNEFIYVATNSGKYSWRVRGVDSYMRFSEWSDWKDFTNIDLSDAISDDGIQKIELKKPDQSVTFNWIATVGSKSIFELSKDKNFNTLVKKIEDLTDSAEVNIPEVGQYYWRSREYLPDGTYHVSEPKRVIIKPVPAPVKPPRLPDLEVPLMDTAPATSFIKHLLNFIIPSAVADDEAGSVRIELPVKEDAKGFVVRIYRDPGLTDLVFEKTIPSKTFEWKNARSGEFYWQYAILDFWDRTSPFSDASILKINPFIKPVPKPKLLYPIRAVAINGQDLILKWTDDSRVVSFKVEISRNAKFDKILYTQETKQNVADFSKETLEAGLYFWRVYSFDKEDRTTLSNRGRFTIRPPLEKKIFIDYPVAQKKSKLRGFLAWAPSSDSYSFKDSKSGKIEGRTLLSFMAGASYRLNNYILNGEVLRQSGKVFDDESYLFQRILFDLNYTWNLNGSLKLSPGLAAGMTSGEAYEIASDNQVKSASVNGLSYGPVVRGEMAINPDWELLGKMFYLLGEIKQWEVGGEAIRKYQSFLMLGGLSFSSRNYELNSGKQNSIKLTFGIGKEF